MPSPSLPAELISHIFLFCEPASFLASVPLVSRHWRRLALDFIGPDGVLINVHIVLTAMDVQDTWQAWHHPTAYAGSRIFFDRFRIVREADTASGSTRPATVAGSVVAHPPHRFLPSDVPRVMSAVLAPLVGYKVCPRVQSVDISQCYNTVSIRTAMRVMREHLALTVHEIRTLGPVYEVAASDEHIQEIITEGTDLLEAFETIRGVYVAPYHNTSTLSVELATLLTVFPNLRRIHFSVAGLRRSLPHPVSSLPPVGALPPEALTQASQLSTFLAPYNSSGGVSYPDVLLGLLVGDFTLFPNLTRLGVFRPLDDAWIVLSQRANELPAYPCRDVKLALQLDASSLPSFTHIGIDDQLAGFNHCIKTMFPHGIRCIELHVYRDGRSPRGEQTELNVWCRVAATVPAPCIEVYTDGVRFGEGQEAVWSARVVAAIRDVARQSGKKHTGQPDEDPSRPTKNFHHARWGSVGRKNKKFSSTLAFFGKGPRWNSANPQTTNNQAMTSFPLPDELFFLMFSFCEPASFFASVPLVSRHWRRLALDFLGPDGVLIGVHLVITALGFRIVQETDTAGVTRLVAVAGSVVAYPPNHFWPSDVSRVMSSVLSLLVGYSVRPRVRSVDISLCRHVMREHLALTVDQIRTLGLAYEEAVSDHPIRDGLTDSGVLLEAFDTIRGVYVAPYHDMSTLSDELVPLLIVLPNLRRIHFSAAGLRRSLPHPVEWLPPEALTQASHLSAFLAPYNSSGGVSYPDVLLGLLLDASNLPSFARRIDDQLGGLRHCLKTLFPLGIQCVELHVYRDGRSPHGEQTDLDLWCRIAASVPAACVEVYTDAVLFGEGEDAAWSARVVAAGIN
ncbi:hypothetical protein M427DRAFT_31465 [Gonapodya prolifera JEL478]|uniref:F-box domain-containing protein n=1 Tax=Gonapodya prolifera (strain JEL478) TaxID=1344416 RepID=A0A139AHW6_GONPJ|nr:hypothetical protein M427DRAFT_31465 [Gonapodya prolifera JEL478]|eukprot:KXS16328.1 hypothetical protein M427DRAFT_31465 [Gonapodya prolifera JEL478]